jgi:hypothetical protein
VSEHLVAVNSKSWLVRRALLAIVGALLWIPYAEVMYVGRVHPQLTLIVVGAALSVLWAILPRIDRFDPPGPRLDALCRFCESASGGRR